MFTHRQIPRGGKKAVASVLRYFFGISVSETKNSMFCVQVTDVQSFLNSPPPQIHSASHTYKYKRLHFPLLLSHSHSALFLKQDPFQACGFILVCPWCFFSLWIYLFKGLDLNLAPRDISGHQKSTKCTVWIGSHIFRAAVLVWDFAGCVCVCVALPQSDRRPRKISLH